MKQLLLLFLLIQSAAFAQSIDTAHYLTKPIPATMRTDTFATNLLTYNQTTHIANLMSGTTLKSYFQNGLLTRTQYATLSARIVADSVLAAGKITIGASIPYSTLTSTPTIPTNTNQLTNGNGFISTETDPTVPSYSKSLNAFSVIKTSTDALYYPLTGNPSNFLTTITSAQVNSVLGYTPYNGVTNPNGYLTSVTYPVTNIFSRTGAIAAQSSDYSAYYPLLASTYTDPSWIGSLSYSKLTGAPANLSSFTNGPGYITNSSLGYTYISKGSNYTITGTEFGVLKWLVIYCDATAGSFTVTLPPATAYPGYTINIVRTDATGANSVTISGLGVSNIVYFTGSKTLTNNASAWYNGN